jgi:hypothetical protein
MLSADVISAAHAGAVHAVCRQKHLFQRGAASAVLLPLACCCRSKLLPRTWLPGNKCTAAGFINSLQCAVQAVLLQHAGAAQLWSVVLCCVPELYVAHVPELIYYVHMYMFWA